MKPKILIIDDEPEFLRVLDSYFSYENLEVQTAESAEAGLNLIAQTQFDAVVTDMAMPQGMSGLDLLKEIRQNDPLLPIILMTGVGTIESAVEAIQIGAFHYVTKPFNPKSLGLLLRRAIESGQMHRRLAQKGDAADQEGSMVIGHSRKIRDVLMTIEKVAGSDAPVLLLGETGTGKSVFARRIHEKSMRRDKPFVTIDCAALAETLLESELFGHVKGAFTGAISAKRGLLEEAQGGTAFLDEIGEIPPSTQVKLLRAIQEQEIKPVGGNQSVRIDTRFISATSRNLDQETKQGRFREDLYFRLAVIPLPMPPLRERLEDLPKFVGQFVSIFNKRYKKNVTRIDPGVMRALMGLPWKGNIRELENTLERAVLLADGNTITGDLLCFQPTSKIAVDFEKELSALSLKEVVEDAEKSAIRQALEESGDNRTLAAKRLGIARRTLYDKMAAYGLE
ncbi:MAG: sigma-54-dependent Fis family transcriptional regulator [Deltaproteobacteria bacterium]|nr:sigma-54-dependent Fis family transcriptional regulator [Deltaproteobacteria bacterium]